MSKQFGIGRAIKEIRRGNAVRRAGWSVGEGESVLVYLPAMSSIIHLRRDLPTHRPRVEPWECNQDDLMAKDWELV